MDNKNKFNTVKIATCNDAHKAEAVNQLFERSLLFNRSDDICGIVISKNDEKQFIPISAIPDNVNIEKREGVVTLVENPVVDSITTKADHNGVDWKSQHKIAETSAERTIILLCTKNIENATNIGVIGGEILEVGEGVYGNYKISLTPTGSGLLIGATTFEQKAALVRAKYNGTYYYGIKFKSTVPANIYFSGWDHFPDGADAPLYTSYNDADLSEIIELGGGDSGGSSGGGMTEAEKAEISAMNTQINTNKNDIAALQTSVAGKAAASHTHDDRYYTESEIDTKLSGKSNTGHKHSASDITSGVLPVANGGTGVTTQADINKAFIGNLDVGTSDVTDGTEFVSSYASNNGFAENDAVSIPYKRKFSTVWNYIKGKISSVLGLTKDNYGGNSATATTAESANKIEPKYTIKDLTAVTTDTTKYIKVADCTWAQTGTLQVRLAGNAFEDTLVINFGGGNGATPMLCGHYSGNSGYVYSVIAQKGSAWNSNYSIYLKIGQLTTCTVRVALLKGACTINITESTTAPTDISEWSTKYGFFGNLTGNATTAGTAAAILDYNRNTPIKVRWGGPGIDSAEWYPAFNADGSALEPINRTNIHAGTADKVASAGNSGTWISGRDNAICKTTSAGEANGWKTLASIKTSSGSIEIGNLSGEDFIRIVYSSDADVSSGTNNVTDLVHIKNGNVESLQKVIATSAGIRIPTSRPSNIEDGDIWIE